ncbi:Glutathione S-transferase [Shimia aestuarii]|uniref:Glutathione S-transferase n=2 Tax=Shimia aestuarii TaxID=254406 RepID=A0A1I4K2Z1_9RHOB|nr:Glutathione S-transferase [Shimia aestuarii]
MKEEETIMADPVLYSFRRCPYAMRARLAVAISGVKVELREILLRDKAPEFLKTSPSATVPCLKAGDLVLDESLDIMIWALQQSDPQGWLSMPADGQDLIARADGPFKRVLDRTKYHTRYPDLDPEDQRAQAMTFLNDLNTRLEETPWLFGPIPTLSDMAILPFVRQFAFIDKPRFDAEAPPALGRWLNTFLASDLFAKIMPKPPVWKAGDPPTFISQEILAPQASGRA